MNPELKRRNKKLARRFTIIGYIMATLFMIGFFIIISFGLKPIQRWGIFQTILTSAMLCFISSLVLVSLSNMKIHQLHNYKNQIKEWRQRNLFHIIINLVIMKKLEEAANLYSRCWFSTSRSYFLRGFIVQAQIKNRDLYSKGLNNLDNIMKNNSPNDVIF